MKNPKTGKTLRIPSLTFFKLIADGYVHDEKNNCLVKDPSIKTPVKVFNPLSNRYIEVGGYEFMKLFNAGRIAYWPEKNRIELDDEEERDILFDEDIYNDFMYDGDIQIE